MQGVILLYHSERTVNNSGVIFNFPDPGEIFNAPEVSFYLASSSVYQSDISPEVIFISPILCPNKAKTMGLKIYLASIYIWP